MLPDPKFEDVEMQGRRSIEEQTNLCTVYFWESNGEFGENEKYMLMKCRL